MTAYLDEMQAYAQAVRAQGGFELGNEPPEYESTLRGILERHATVAILAQGEKFFSTEITRELGLPETSLGPEQQWVQSLCECMTRKGPINGRMLFQSKDRPRRFFWIVEEE